MTSNTPANKSSNNSNNNSDAQKKSTLGAKSGGVFGAGLDNAGKPAAFNFGGAAGTPFHGGVLGWVREICANTL